MNELILVAFALLSILVLFKLALLCRQTDVLEIRELIKHSDGSEVTKTKIRPQYESWNRMSDGQGFMFFLICFAILIIALATIAKLT